MSERIKAIEEDSRYIIGAMREELRKAPHAPAAKLFMEHILNYIEVCALGNSEAANEFTEQVYKDTLEMELPEHREALKKLHEPGHVAVLIQTHAIRLAITMCTSFAVNMAMKHHNELDDLFAHCAVILQGEFDNTIEAIQKTIRKKMIAMMWEQTFREPGENE